MIDEIKEHLTNLEKISGKVFGDPKNPLLVFVRSVAPAFMPGMMDIYIEPWAKCLSYCWLSKKQKNLSFIN